MSGKIRTRLAVIGALAALVAVLVPAGLASGSHADDPSTGDPSWLLLTLGKTDEITWTADGSAVQTIKTRNNDCFFIEFGGTDLLTIDAPGDELLGHVKDGFGAELASGSSGDPCGKAEADKNESISVSLGSALAGDYLFRAIDVDLELKFDASVDVIFKHEGTEVTTVQGWMADSGADDNPDSGNSDNFRFNSNDVLSDGDTSLSKQVSLPILFDEVVFVPQAGALSLEGGADGTVDGTLVEGEANNSSQLEIVKTFDGEMTCGDVHDFPEDTSLVNTIGAVTLHAMEFDPDGETWVTEFSDIDCLLKLFNDDTGDASLAFVPELDDVAGRFTIMVTVEGQPVTTDGTGTINSLQAQYNLNGDISFGPTADMQACNGQPVDDKTLDDGNGTDDNIADDYHEYWQQNDPVYGTDGAGSLIVDGDGDPVPLLPGTETICFYSSGVTITGVDASGNPIGTETWKIYFEDDPGMFM